MSNWNGFDSLDLSGVQGSTGSARLPSGSYKVKVSEAKVEGEGPRRKVVITFVDEGGMGDIRVNFHVMHPSAEAQRIGMEQLKGFLETAGHPNPDKPGDISSLVGLKCAVIVGMGKPWKDSEGKTRQNTEVKKYLPYDSAVSGPASESGAAPASVDHNAIGSKLDDEIPF